jgi:hypothetical protein
VTVPKGINPGDTIHVSVPSDPRKLLQAVVPEGLGPGGVFVVQAPPEGDNDGDGEEEEDSSQSSSDESSHDQQKDPTTSWFSQALDSRDPPIAAAAPTPRVANTHLKKSLLKVAVPLGTKPGAIIHVSVPGEKGRLIAAKVPPNCTEFHVEYLTEVKTEGSGNSYYHRSPGSRGADAPEEKMLLVRVPHGAKVGQVIHVEIPDEPDRMIPATIPPGGVKEFHIKYRPYV